MSEYNNSPDRFYEDKEVIKHQLAMTTEGLHGKFDIAVELGWRDKQIAAKDAEIEKLHSENSWKQMRIEIQGEAVVKLEAQLAAHQEFAKAFDAFRVESFDDIDVDSYFEGWIDMGNIAKARQALEEK